MPVPVQYLFFALLIAVGAYVVFRVFVRRSYINQGRLTVSSSILQLLIWVLVFIYPIVYSGAGWGWSWSAGVEEGSLTWWIGLAFLCAGFVVAFGTMAWFGIRRAFGRQVDHLISSGPYRFTRNPQILGGYLLVIGSSIIWQSWYNLIWVSLYGAVAHLMVITEEEHLQQIFGEEYIQYKNKTPRYIGLRKMTSAP